MPVPERLLKTRSAQPLDGFGCVIHRTGRAAAWLGLTGDLDLAAAPRLTACLDDALSTAWLVVVDLRELRFIDTTGLAAILTADERARRSERRLVLVRGPGQVTRLIGLTSPGRRVELADLSAVLPDRAQVAGGAPASPAGTDRRRRAAPIA